MDEISHFSIDSQREQMVSRIPALRAETDSIFELYGDVINGLNRKFANKTPETEDEKLEYMLSRKPLELKLAVEQFAQLLEPDNSSLERPEGIAPTADDQIRSNDFIMDNLIHEIAECKTNLEKLRKLAS